MSERGKKTTTTTTMTIHFSKGTTSAARTPCGQSGASGDGATSPRSQYPIMISRFQEKNDLAHLNDRVRQLELENRRLTRIIEMPESSSSHKISPGSDHAPACSCQNRHYSAAADRSVGLPTDLHITHPDSFISLWSDDALDDSQLSAQENKAIEGDSASCNLRLGSNITRPQIRCSCGSSRVSNSDETLLPFQQLPSGEIPDIFQAQTVVAPKNEPFSVEIRSGKLYDLYQCSFAQNLKGFKEVSTTVRVIPGKNGIILQGQESDVSKKKEEILEALFPYSLVGKTFEMEEGILKMLEEEKFGDHIERCLMESSVDIAWEKEGCSSNNITIYGLTESHLNYGVRIINAELMYQEIELNEKICKTLKNPLWLQERKKLESQSLLMLEQSDMKIKISGISQLVQNAKEQIELLLCDKKIPLQNFLQPPRAFPFLFKPVAKESRKIIKSFRNKSLKIEWDEATYSCIISGPNLFIRNIEKQITGLADKIRKEEVYLKRLGMSEHFKDAIKTKLQNIQMKHGVYIEVVTDSLDSIQTRVPRNEDTANCAPQLFENGLEDAFQRRRLRSNGVMVTLKGDEIVKCRVDAIVNVVNEQLKYIDGVSANVGVTGGLNIQEECDEFIARYGPRLEGYIYKSSSGILPCNNILHVVSPDWSSEHCDATLRQTITGILNRAEKFGYKSLALPLIGALTSGLNVKEVCEIIQEAITGWAAVASVDNLREVWIVGKDSHLKCFQQLMDSNDDFGDICRPDTITTPEQVAHSCDPANQTLYEIPVRLRLYALHPAAIERALKELEHYCTTVIKSYVINDEEFRMDIASLTAKQVDKIKSLEKNFCVLIDVNKDLQRIHIEGEEQFIYEVKHKISDLLKQM